MLIEANVLSCFRRLPIFNFTNQATTLDHESQIKDNHVLILHGGGDISPALYNKPVAPRGGGYYKPSHRDQQEWAFIKEAVKQNIPIVGICRGAQMLCAFDGGELVQHINNHAGHSHTIHEVKTGDVYVTNSCHHQMMVPSKHAEVIAYCEEDTIGYREDDSKMIVKRVPEVVYFPQLNALGIQGHPEWMGNGNQFVQYCTSLINSLLLK